MPRFTPQMVTRTGAGPAPWDSMPDSTSVHRGLLSRGRERSWIRAHNWGSN